MKKKLFLYFFGMSIIFASFSCQKDDDIKTPQNGTIDKTLTMHSTTMDTLVHYSVYYPPGYESSNDNYPVLYLLHGMGEDHLTWPGLGMKEVMDSCINAEIVKPMIVIMPQAFNSFYLNYFIFEAVPYEDFLVNEFVPYIESTYRVKTEKNNTSIAGNSMGGFGSTYLAFKYNQKFGSSYSMGGALLEGFLSAVIESKTSDELNNLPEYAMAVGEEDDVTLESNEAFDAYLTSKNIDHSYRKRPLGHWNWIADFPYALDLASNNFD